MPFPRLPGRADLRLLFSFPRVSWRVLKGYGRVLAGQKRPLRGVEFAVTYRCLLNCEHCLTKPLIDPDREEMTAAQAVRAIRDLADFGVLFVNVTGGEPLLREDIFDILAGAGRGRDMLITLASNGLLIDGKTARDIKRSGVAIVALSLDGPDAKSHDKSRGSPGAFDKLMAAVDNLKSACVPIWFTTILTRENAADGSVFKTAELARKLGATMTVNWTYAVGKNWSENEPLVSPVEREAFFRLLEMPHVRWEGSTNFRSAGCPAGSEKIYVTPYGDVFPCAIIQASFGNLFSEPIAEIWERMGRVPEFDGRTKHCLVACEEDFIRTHFEKIRRAPGRPYEGWGVK